MDVARVRRFASALQNKAAVDPAHYASKKTISVWCGTYKPFDGNPTVDVQLTLTSLKPMGQMLDIRGSMNLGSVTTPVQGNLHAKSDQLSLIPLGDPLIAGAESGGVFLGLQGFGPMGWEPPRLVNTNDFTGGIGGRLALSTTCNAVPVQPLW